MNDNKLFKLTNNNNLRRLIHGSFNSREQLEEVIKFHQSTTLIPLNNLKNIEKYSEKESWENLISEIEPNFTFCIGKEIDKVKRNETPINKGYKFIKNRSFDDQIIEYLLVNSFSKFRQSYVIPLLIVLDDNAVNGISSGCYVYSTNESTLNKVKELNNEELNKINSVLHTKGIPSYTAICYAIDIQKSATIYGKRGYRNVLIEVGALKNSFEETLSSYSDNFKAQSETEFPDNALSKILGMNIRLAPIILIQWFGII